MRKQILIPDMDATTEIDILEEMLISEVDRLDQAMREIAKEEPPASADLAGRQAEWILDKKNRLEAADAEWSEANENLNEYRANPEPKAKITIGYIPARVITELDFEWVEAAKGREDIGPYSAELGNAFMHVCREYVRHGVKGHNITNGDFDIEKALDIYERNNWLYTLMNRIKEYNSLPAEKKMGSSSSAGTSQESMTVTCAEVNPTFSEQEDAKSQAE